MLFAAYSYGRTFGFREGIRMAIEALQSPHRLRGIGAAGPSMEAFI
jgi:hypothetical protein